MRVWCLWLALIVAAGPAWLDRCLANCHETGVTVAASECHERAPQASSLPAWQSTESCHHEHDASWAPISDLKTDSQTRSISTALPAGEALAGVRPVAAALVAADDPPGHLAFQAFPLPLRV